VGGKVNGRRPTNGEFSQVKRDLQKKSTGPERSAFLEKSLETTHRKQKINGGDAAESGLGEQEKRGGKGNQVREVGAGKASA